MAEKKLIISAKKYVGDSAVVSARLPVELIKAATTATEIESPLEAEKILNNFRLEFLETLRPIDSFSEEYVYYYGLKLKLIQHLRQFDSAAGEAAYRNIYNSIINGDRLEAI